MTIKIAAAVAATALMLAAAPAFAQQGTTLAGPAQGQKADGSASTVPSAASGANGGAMMKSGNGSMMKSGGGSMMKGGSTSSTTTGGATGQ